MNQPAENVSLAAQIRCIEREIGMRQRVYPRWVAAGKLTARVAEQEIAAMQAVKRTLQDVMAGDLEGLP